MKEYEAATTDAAEDEEMKAIVPGHGGCYHVNPGQEDDETVEPSRSAFWKPGQKQQQAGYAWQGPFKDPRRYGGKPAKAKAAPTPKSTKTPEMSKCELRRNLQRAETKIAQLKAEIAQLEAEIFKRDVVQEACQMVSSLQQKHLQEIADMKKQLTSQEKLLEVSNLRLTKRQTDTTVKTREQEQALLLALQQHKKLQDEAKVSSAAALADMEGKMRHWFRTTLEKEKALTATQRELDGLKIQQARQDRAIQSSDGTSAGCSRESLMCPLLLHVFCTWRKTTRSA